MHLRERVLGLARLHRMRGEPIPTDLLAELDSLGILLSELGEPANPTFPEQPAKKERTNGSSSY